MGHRDKRAIASEMIEKSRNGARKTQLMSRVGMSTTQVNIYLDELEKRKLLEKKDNNGNGGIKWYATETGKEFVIAYRKVEKYYPAN